MKIKKLMFIFLLGMGSLPGISSWGKPEMPYDAVIEYADIPGLVLLVSRNDGIGFLENSQFTPAPISDIPGVFVIGAHQVLVSPDEVAYLEESLVDQTDTPMIFWNRKDGVPRAATFPGHIYTIFHDREKRTMYLIRKGTTYLGYMNENVFFTEELHVPFMKDYLESYGYPQDETMERHRKYVLEDGDGDSNSFEMFQEVKPGSFILSYSDRIFFWDRSEQKVRLLLGPVKGEVDNMMTTSTFHGDKLIFTFDQKIYEYAPATEALKIIRDFSDWKEKYHGSIQRIDFKSPTEYLIYGGRGEAGRWGQTLSYWVSGEKIYKLKDSIFRGRIDNNYVAFR